MLSRGQFGTTWQQSDALRRGILGTLSCVCGREPLHVHQQHAPRRYFLVAAALERMILALDPRLRHGI
jgi:hypothetical protein